MAVMRNKKNAILKPNSNLSLFLTSNKKEIGPVIMPEKYHKIRYCAIFPEANHSPQRHYDIDKSK